MVDKHVRIEMATKPNRKKLMFGGFFLLLTAIVIIVALTSQSTQSDPKLLYRQNKAEKTGSHLFFNSQPPTFSMKDQPQPTQPTPPTPNPTRQPTKRPTKDPTPAPISPPTVEVLPPTWPTPAPTFPPAEPTTAPPTKDIIKGSMCTGVNVVYRSENSVMDDVFHSCPTSKMLEYYADQPIGFDRFSIKKFKKPKFYEMQPRETKISLGLKEFLSQVWKDKPIPQQHGQHSGPDPYLQISRSVPQGYSDRDIRNWLNYINDHRVQQYIAKSKENQKVISVVGRTVYFERFRVEVSPRIEANHLSAEFRRRVRMIAQQSRTDQSIDTFFDKFGTHYRKVGIFGGRFGVDYYFSGYGTPKDQDKALQHVLNADLSVCFTAQGRNQRLVTEEFKGFADSEVECYPWSRGGDHPALYESVDKWQRSVDQKPVLIKEELASIIDLIRVVTNDQRLLNTFHDRIVSRSEEIITAKDGCIYRPCDSGKSCIDNQCMEKTVAPRWPNAVSFCLPKPHQEVCPSDYEEFYPGSWVYWDTENGDGKKKYKGADHITSHGLTNAQVNGVRHYTGSRNGGIQLFFCCYKKPRANHMLWPKGTYCLYAYRYVSMLYDPAWSMVSIIWNDEDDNNKNAISHAFDIVPKIPMGRYDNYSSFTEQTLLCRQDGLHENAIILPTSYPFYLVQNGVTCQEVFGMYWTHVQITWDTENDHRPYVDGSEIRWNRIGKIPRNCPEHCRGCIAPDLETCWYVGHDKIVMDFCYYQELETPSPTKFPTVPPTPPTPSPVFPTAEPTTGSPSAPPQPLPTPPPTPFPTRPTPPPTSPSPPPTPDPTPFPTKAPTKTPTPAPIAPTPDPTPFPTIAPTPSPTEPCYACIKMQGVNIVGLNSIWDPQPTEYIFDFVDCECTYCNASEKIEVRGQALDFSLCPVEENCKRNFLVGDYMLLEKFWDDIPVKLTADDMIFRDVAFFDDNIDENYYAPLRNSPYPLTGGSDDELLAAVKEHTQIDLRHARDALLFAGSQRMINYNLAYSTLERHIGTERKDTIFSVSHVVMRGRKFKYVTAKWTRLPIADDLSESFKEDAMALFKMHDVYGFSQKIGQNYSKFINKYGTHFIYEADFGGEYGADFFYTGYGTKPEMKIALNEASNTNLQEAFQHNRVRAFNDFPLSGRSFIRSLNGKAEVGPDIIGWSRGGTEYGIRKSKTDVLDKFGQTIWDWTDWRWRESITNGEDIVIWHKQLHSIGDLLFTYAENQSYADVATEAKELFKLNVVLRAHLWLVKHYRCYFLDGACENRRRHPFPREVGSDRTCATAKKVKYRTRTELEVCVGQENRNTGYTSFSTKDTRRNPRSVTWCEGARKSASTGVPSNYPPYKPVDPIVHCSHVPPPPRWPVFFSYCFPKPVGQKSCPVEQYPEYFWSYDWEGKMQETFKEHQLNKHALMYVMKENRVYSTDEYTNVNPYNLVWTVYPWSFPSNEYNPRTGQSWEKWEYEEVQKLERDRTRREKDWDKDEERRITFEGLSDPDKKEYGLKLLESSGHNSLMLNRAEIGPFIDGEIKKIRDESDQKKLFGINFGKFTLNYDPSDDTADAYKLYPVNRVYVLHQTPWIDYHGWAFWDTENDNDFRKDSMIVDEATATPTHMDVARLFEYDEVVAKSERYQQVMSSLDYQMSEGMKDLWEYNYTQMKFDYSVGGIRMDYCCTSIAEDQMDKNSHNLHWPDGHFCIYAHGAIDSTAYKFLHGSIGWDCENGADGVEGNNMIYFDVNNEAMEIIAELMELEGNLRGQFDNQQRLTQALPTGLYHIQYDQTSEQYISQNVLCTRMDINQENDIELPRDSPFYLMQYYGECQKVRGMYYTNVTLTWATERHHKRKWEGFGYQFIELEMNSWGHATAYGHIDQLPVGRYSQKEIAISYCYYQPNAIRSYSQKCTDTDYTKCGGDWSTVAMDENGEYTRFVTRNATKSCPLYIGISG